MIAIVIMAIITTAIIVVIASATPPSSKSSLKFLKVPQSSLRFRTKTDREPRPALRPP